MKRLKRIVRHLSVTPWRIRRHISSSTMKQIELAIQEAEATCSGQIQVVIEGALPASSIWKKLSGRERAIDVFSLSRVWDTENNNGVLLYLLMADRDIEIVADRGIAKRVTQQEWEEICQLMEKELREGRFESGLIKGIHAVALKLSHHFPMTNAQENELSNKPFLI